MGEFSLVAYMPLLILVLANAPSTAFPFLYIIKIKYTDCISLKTINNALHFGNISSQQPFSVLFHINKSKRE